ncbi:uncharacterized protein T551_00880 [Pneumocystis jirovecii RU7]|uniref:Uncharacterized protein n=1 Tax=Pneumocystis jirovecii (strain RU7) TaxID=1408657 RepID=A0A0W4ZUZ1_PNEJ7|nr:uncharacterized protein T551_00880 [Pneumocystis jirovecii RU7]KTW32198.1 hypothetical protein T551_00880 [Pneumocystis jirovecii RU7]
MTDNSEFSTDVSNECFDNNDSIDISKIKEIELYKDSGNYEDLIKTIIEKQKKLSVILNEIDDVKSEYEKLYNEKQTTQEYIANLMKIYNKSAKK